MKLFFCLVITLHLAFMYFFSSTPALAQVSTPDEYGVATFNSLLPKEVKNEAPNLASSLSGFFENALSNFLSLFGFQPGDQKLFSANTKQLYQSQLPSQFSQEQDQLLKDGADIFQQTADSLKDAESGVYPLLFPQEIKQEIKDVREAEKVYEMNYPPGVNPISNP